MAEQSSDILRWTVLKNVLYRLVEGAVFWYISMHCTEDSFRKFGGWSILQLHCGVLYWRPLYTGGGGAVFKYSEVDYTED